MAEKEALKQAKKKKISELPASKFMSMGAITIDKSYTIISAVKVLETHNIGEIPVVDAGKKLLGIISGYDLLLQAAHKKHSEKITFVEGVISVNMETKLKDVIILFYKKRLKLVPVVSSSKTVMGTISRMNLLKVLCNPDDYT